jgi:DNA-binding NarL/FixJ family response regulator
MMHHADPIRVLIAGQNSALRAELCRIMGTQNRIQVIAQVDTAEEAVNMTLAYHPDLVLIDMAIQGSNGLATTREIKEQRPTIPVILLTILSEPEYLSVARYSGVDRCLNRRDIDQKLLPLIESVLAPALRP